ncbi:MAG: tyrosine-type recombinase/integrase [Candidatus Shapirobacteria bacterium]|nr:tyrosine-type recombinase/integrase [Candidatus Shapirobacteria bacterium]MDD4410355.1 tyrosine-type recombinase/integrase [Candidatus Shapirobacteria bacterium]
MENDLDILIRRFLEHLEIERNCSRLTIRNYQHYLDVLVHFLSEENKDKKLTINNITSDVIRRFRLFLARQKGSIGEMKLVTQGYYVIALRSFLKWLVKNDYKVLQPEKLDVPRTKDHSLKFLDGDQMERLLVQPLPSSKSGFRDRAILELLFSTGLRVSELVRLNRDQINLKTREFGVIGKGGRSRVVFISIQAAEHVAKYLMSREDKYKPLFIRNLRPNEIPVSDEAVRLTARSIQRLVKHYVKTANLPVEATPHTLRHSMATDLLRAGADLRSVQEILGHKNIATTQIYTHVTDARLREIHNKYHSGNRGENK